MEKNIKPLGRKSYGSIAHLPDSRMGPSDHHIHKGQAIIATEKVRDKHDVVIVQEKLDGSNVGIANINGEIVAITRSGYEAHTSPHEMHHVFNQWVKDNESRFRKVLFVGDRLCGEWLTQAHSTKYKLPHEPFVAFDIIDSKNKRVPYIPFSQSVGNYFTTAHTIHVGEAISIQHAMSSLGIYGCHGAIEQVEGAIWRVERKGVVDFLCKYVRPDKVDGKYLKDKPVLNTWIERQ